MTESEEEVRARELPINRAIYWLRQGVADSDITAKRIGVDDEQLSATIATAKTRMIENDKAYAAMTRQEALGYLAFGTIMLLLALYLAQGDVPLLREGRLALAFAIGTASLAWGLFRLFNQNPRYHF